MVLKRQFGEGSDNTPILGNSRSSTAKFRKVVQNALKEASLQEFATNISAILEPTLRRVVKEEVETLLFCLQSSPRSSLTHRPEPSDSRVLQLHFTNNLPSTLFTNSSIRDEEHAPLQIKLIDARSKNVIQHGSLSSIKVQVLVLSADFASDGREDWSESEFKQSIVRERDGKRPLLVGDLFLSLVNGVGYVGSVNFTDNSSWVRSRRFRLGVRAVSTASGGAGIREAVSEAFVVLDHRGEAYKKHRTPSLGDPVWRLKKISKMGASQKKLESHGIMTVKDFLMHYHINPSFLRNVLGKGVANRAWETIVKHANECHLDNNHYSYYNAVERVELLFNCVYKVIAVKFEGQAYQPVDTLDFSQKALVDKLKQFAFNQNELVPIHSLPVTYPLACSTVQQDIPFSGASLELLQDDPSIVDQDESDQQLAFDASDSATYPCTVEDCYLPEDDSTAQSNQLLQGFSPATFLFGNGNSDTQPSEGDYDWLHANSPAATFAPKTQFFELSHPQTPPFFPLASAWEQGDGFSTTVDHSAAHVSIFSQLPGFGVHISGTGKSKAGWCKIKAAVMWKIVRRDAAAKRKAKFPILCY